MNEKKPKEKLVPVVDLNWDAENVGANGICDRMPDTGCPVGGCCGGGCDESSCCDNDDPCCVGRAPVTPEK